MATFSQADLAAISERITETAIVEYLGFLRHHALTQATKLLIGYKEPLNFKGLNENEAEHLKAVAGLLPLIKSRAARERILREIEERKNQLPPLPEHRDIDLRQPTWQ